MSERELIGPFPNKNPLAKCTHCNLGIARFKPIFYYKQRRTQVEINDNVQAKGMIVLHEDCLSTWLPRQSDNWTTKKPSKFHSDSPSVVTPSIEQPVNPTSQPVTIEDTPPMSNDPLGKAIADAIGPYIQSKVSQNDVKSIFDDMFHRAFDLVKKDLQSPVSRIEVKLPDGDVIDCGVQHFKFPSLLKRAPARKACDGNLLNWWLYGPAGSGKTRITLEIAKALKSPRYFATGSIVDTSIIFGHKNPLNGEYYRTAFRDVWEHGGDAVFDDFSGSDPVLAVELLGILGNSVACFPDGMVKRHNDCRLWFADNTTGNGSTASYNGRFKMDAALVNRFTFFEIPYDEQLEIVISGNEKWAKTVQQCRKLCLEKEIKCVISPRQSIDGAALLAIGIPVNEVLHDVIAPRMSSTQWDSIKGMVQ